MNFNKTMSRMRTMLPRKKGMSTKTKIMLMAIPIATFALGKMMAARSSRENF